MDIINFYLQKFIS